MSSEERQLMKRIDAQILGATDEQLRELQELDIKTQLSGITFYENVINSDTLVKLPSSRRTSKSQY